MFLLVSDRHVGAHPDGHQHGVSIQISINLDETLLRIVNNSRDLILGDNHLSYPRFLSLFIERLQFLVLIT